MNEKMSPELLPPLTHEKEAGFSVLNIMEKNLSKLEDTDVRTGIHRLEVLFFTLIYYAMLYYLSK